MRAKGYFIFHLNLAFSSIEEESWPEVIQTCYHPLLDLIETTAIPVGIEVSGWTLNKINEIDKSWIKRFKSLLSTELCEIIGSGYCQIIGPLVPSKVNDWNQKLGLEVYNNILNSRPEIVLVNEMAYSSSLVDLYAKHEYKGFIMDRDNVRLALKIESLPISETPTHAIGANDSTLPVLWADSILFQKLQQYAHGDISMSDYINYLMKRIAAGEILIPIYSNDAEVFDYRPGRFNEERASHPDGEWNRIIKLFDSVEKAIDIEWISPSQALSLHEKSNSYKASCLTSATHPIPVKKQAKYNIARWAVTGRNDLWLNTMCHRIAKHFTDSQNNNSDDWRGICELWASDLRTHITEDRWNKAKNKLENILRKNHIYNGFNQCHKQDISYDNIDEAVGTYGGATVELDKDGILLKISTKNINIELNLRRGLAIQSLSFGSHGMQPSLLTLPHGYFSSISLGADYYSGNTVIELPTQRRRITDLEQVSPSFFIKENGDIEIHASITTYMGTIYKKVTISTVDEHIALSYNFLDWKELVGSVRVGTLTFSPEFLNGEINISCHNGGDLLENFSFKDDAFLGSAASTLVSSTSGFGATTGNIVIGKGEQLLDLRWNQSECAVMPIVQHRVSHPDHLSRVTFSMLELDDTSRNISDLGFFELNISTGKK